MYNYQLFMTLFRLRYQSLDDLECLLCYFDLLYLEMGQAIVLRHYHEVVIRLKLVLSQIEQCELRVLV